MGDLCPRGSLSRETPPIRLRAGGTHPTGMNSCCYIIVAVFSCIHAEPSANLLNSLASFSVKRLNCESSQQVQLIPWILRSSR